MKLPGITPSLPVSSVAEKFSFFLFFAFSLRFCVFGVLYLRAAIGQRAISEHPVCVFRRRFCFASTTAAFGFRVALFVRLCWALWFVDAFPSAIHPKKRAENWHSVQSGECELVRIVQKWNKGNGWLWTAKCLAGEINEWSKIRKAKREVELSIKFDLFILHNSRLSLFAQRALEFWAADCRWFFFLFSNETKSKCRGRTHIADILRFLHIFFLIISLRVETKRA